MSVVIEPFFICLFASMIWAPVVFLLGAQLQKQSKAPDISDKIWPATLVVATLPALFAPVAASLGLSLRQAPPVLPPMAEPIGVVDYEPAPIAVQPLAAPETIALSDILTAAASIYFYGFVLFFALGLIRMIWFACRVQYAYHIDEPRLEAGFEQWRKRMKIKRAPNYAFTDVVSSVCVHGFFRPKILMPMNLLDRISVDDVILMGAHEMAHIKRGDTWLFAFASAMKALFWFNPFIHRIAARANLAAEQAADALVISRGADRRDYAKCFVEGLKFAAGASRPEQSLVPSFTPFDKKSRRERLDAILSKTGNSALLGISAKAGMGLSIIAAAGLAFAQAALAVAPKPPKEALPETPVEGEITFGFGKKGKVLGEDRPTHEGVDIKATKGTPVRAAGAGKVIDATDRYKGQKAWGNVVVIDHGHGLVTRYAHLDKFDVEKGDHVDAGDIIGAVGETGKTTGPHLHFEVLQDGAHIDPEPVISAQVNITPPVIKTTNRIKVKTANITSPAGRPLPAPKVVAVAPPPAPPVIDERLDKKLAGKVAQIDKRLREKLLDFNAFAESHDFAVDIGDIEFEGLNEFVESMGEFDFHFDGVEVELPQLASLMDGFELSEEDRAEIYRARDEAMREVHAAMEDAQREIAKAQKQRERALREAQREIQAAQREYEREIARTESERERALEEANRVREEALEEANQARAEAMENHRAYREEILAEREQALREAQEEIERERAEIARLRVELERQRSGAEDNE